MNIKLSQGIFSKIKTFATAHKGWTTAIVVIVILIGYRLIFGSSSSTTTKYILATASKGTLITSISGSGQVAAENQVTVTSKVSGTINAVYVNPGDEVTIGQTLAAIDNADAVRAVNNAQLSLENAQVAYQKAVKEANDQSATSSASDLAKAYQSGYNYIVSTAIDLPAIFSSLNDIYYSSSHSPYFSDINITTQVDSIAATYKLQSGSAFDDARKEYNAHFTDYKNISADSSPDQIYALLKETNVILQKTLNALSETYTTIDYIQNKISKVPTELTTDKSTLSGFVSKVNSDTTNVTNAMTSIDNSQTSGTTANLNMKSAELAVKQAEATLSDAQTALSDHKIKAPFSGLVAKVIAKEGDTASNGTQIATLVTKEQMVNISLNEIDAEKVSKNDKVTLTFDAIDGLTLAGHVSNVDLVGSVSQGVVTYTVEIAFDDIDSRVKPGMTVNANIITEVKQDVLTIPSSSIKTQNGTSYVQIFSQKYDDTVAAAGVTSSVAPTNVAVTVGSSNDSLVEITSGIKEGDQVVSRTVTSTSKTSTTPSILSSLTGNRGAAGGSSTKTTSSAASTPPSAPPADGK